MTDRQKVELYGHEIAYVSLPGDGVPMLLVHGVGSSIDTWGDIPQRLADAGRAVVAIDLLGHGESGHGNGDYSLGANASAMRDLLDHLGIERVHLVGHSLGGGVSLQFGYQFPERVESLALISSGGLGTDVGMPLRAASLPGSEIVLRAATRPGIIRAMARAGTALSRFGVEPAVLSDRALSKLEHMQDEQRLQAFVATVRSVVGPDGQRVSALKKLGKVDPSRVLIVWGDQDPMLPMQHGLDAAELLPGCRVVLVPGAEHHPHTHAPELVTAELLAHVARTAPLPVLAPAG
jgi:pimeloyl-ACP methyl ester carboxylesterase